MTKRKEHTPWSRRDAALRKARAAGETPVAETSAAGAPRGRKPRCASQRPPKPSASATPEIVGEMEAPVVAPRPVAVRLATIDDLRGLAEEWRGRIVDFVTSGAPISTLRRMLEAEQGLRFTEDAPVVEFYQEEARRRWQNTFDTASADADAMINVLRHSDLDFSEVLLKALGQQAFRMITQRELNTKQVEKFTRLLLQARGQDVSRTRAKEALALQREKMERQFQSDLEKALNALAEEIKAHPEVRESFVFFRAKLKDAMKKKKAVGPEIANVKLEISKGEGKSADDADLHRFKTGEENQNKEILSENLRSSAKSADESVSSGLPSPVSHLP